MNRLRSIAIPCITAMSRFTRVISIAPSSVAMMKRESRAASTSSRSCGRASQSSDWICAGPPLEHHLDALRGTPRARRPSRPPGCRTASRPCIRARACSATSVSMNRREPLQRIDHRLPQDREAALGEPLELAVEHLVAQRFLRLEVVVEVTLPAEPRRLRSRRRPRSRVNPRSLMSAAAASRISARLSLTDTILGPRGPIVKLFAMGCVTFARFCTYEMMPPAGRLPAGAPAS